MKKSKALFFLLFAFSISHMCLGMKKKPKMKIEIPDLYCVPNDILDDISSKMLNKYANAIKLPKVSHRCLTKQYAEEQIRAGDRSMENFILAGLTAQVQIVLGDQPGAMFYTKDDLYFWIALAERANSSEIEEVLFYRRQKILGQEWEALCLKYAFDSEELEKQKATFCEELRALEAKYKVA